MKGLNNPTLVHHFTSHPRQDVGVNALALGASVANFLFEGACQCDAMAGQNADEASAGDLVSLFLI